MPTDIDPDSDNAPASAQTALRAAEYVRMSTEHQQYSTENQSDVIRDYATAHGMEIVRLRGEVLFVGQPRGVGVAANGVDVAADLHAEFGDALPASVDIGTSSITAIGAAVTAARTALT